MLSRLGRTIEPELLYDAKNITPSQWIRNWTGTGFPTEYETGTGFPTEYETFKTIDKW